MEYTDFVIPYPPYDEIDQEAADYAFKLLAWSGMPLSTSADPVADLPADLDQKMTPYRLARYLRYWYRPKKTIRFTTFPNLDQSIDQVIVIDPVPFWACCSHHMLPFFGHIHFGYIPGSEVVGLSMIPLHIQEFCARPWMQEAMTQGLANLFRELLGAPIALGIISEATHTCQMLDLGGPPVPKMTFSVMYGKFRSSARARDEFLKLSGFGY